MLIRSPPRSPPSLSPDPLSPFASSTPTSLSPPSSPLKVLPFPSASSSSSSLISGSCTDAGDRASRTSQTAPFIEKIYRLVDDHTTDEVISWSYEGSSFIIWNPPSFTRDLLPIHLSLNSFSTFVRTLLTFGFRKVRPDRWEFENHFFRRGKEGLLFWVQRRKVEVDTESRLFSVKITDVNPNLGKSSSTGNLSSVADSQSSLSGSSTSGSMGPPQPEDYSFDDADNHTTGSPPSSHTIKGIPWSKDEHRLFLVGLHKLGKGDWRGISRSYVVSRTPTQVASHAQKFFLYQRKTTKRKGHSTPFDAAADLLPVQEEHELPSPEVIDPDVAEILPYKFDWNFPQTLDLAPSEYDQLPAFLDSFWPVHDPFSSASAVPPADKICFNKSHQQIPLEEVFDSLEQLYPKVEAKCSKINRMQELSSVCKHEILDLHYCLNSIDLSFVRHLTGLKYLTLKGCFNLRRIPSMVELKSLLSLDLSDCFNVKELPELPKNMKFLYLGGTAIEELPLSIIRLSTLLVLDLRYCTRLKKLPSGICELKSLEILDLSGCFSLPHLSPELLLEEMVRGFVKQECTRELGQISRLFSPWDIGQVLTKVWIAKKVEEILLHMSKLMKIHLDADSLTRIFHVSMLKIHFIFCVAASKPLPITCQVENFVELRIPYNNFQQLWTGRLGLVNVRLIDIKHSNLMSLPDFSEAQKLVSLNLRGCINLLNVSSISNLTKLEHLDLRGCKSLTVLPSVANLKILKTFYLSGCSNLKALPPLLGHLHSLNVLDLNSCTGLKVLPKSIKDLRSLQKLNVSGCGALLNRLEGSKTKALPSSIRSHLSGSTYKSGKTSTNQGAFQSKLGAATYKQKACTSKKAKKEFAVKAVEIQDNAGKARDEEDTGKEATKLEDRKRKRESSGLEWTACEEQKGKRSHGDLNEVIDLKSRSSLETEPSEKNANGTSGDRVLFDSRRSSPKSPTLLMDQGAVTPHSHEVSSICVSKPILSSQDSTTCDALDDARPLVECSTEVGISSREKVTSESKKEINMVMQQMNNNADRLGVLKWIPRTHNLNSKDGKSLDSHIENDKNIEDYGKLNALKDEIDMLQKQLAALEKRRDDMYQYNHSLESELEPLHVELQNFQYANLTEQKLKLEEAELEALSGWEDVKKMVAEEAFDLRTIF